MWPKVFAQLVELLPHISRLIPMADKFFASKMANERTTDAALAAMVEGVRDDLGQTTATHAGLYRQLQEQSSQGAEIARDVRRLHGDVEASAVRLRVLEKQTAALASWTKAGVGLLVVVLGLLVALLVRGR